MKSLLLVLLLVLFVGSIGHAAGPAADGAVKIKPLLPAGWSIAVEKDIVTITREKPVEWYGTISLPAHNDKADLKARGFVQSGAYTITVNFGPPMTPLERSRLVDENTRMKEDYYQKHPVDPHDKPTAPPKELTEKLHRIPNLLAADYSAVVTPFIQGSLAFYDDGDKAECLRVEQAIRKVLSDPNDVADQPARGTRTSMKGWELYVWNQNGEAHFSLLPGTNRLKTADEITKAAVKGIEAIKPKLDELKAGESVSIHGRKLLEQPPAEPGRDVAAYCKNRGLKTE